MKKFRGLPLVAPLQDNDELDDVEIGKGEWYL